MSEREYHQHSNGDVVQGPAIRCADPESGAVDVRVAPGGDWVNPADHAIALSIIAQRRGSTTVEWRFNGPDGPAYGMEPDHPEAERVSRRFAQDAPGRWVERREITTYLPDVSDWERIEVAHD